MQNQRMKPHSSKKVKEKKKLGKLQKVLIVVGAVVLCLALFVHFYFFTSPAKKPDYQFSSNMERQAIAEKKYNEILSLTTPPPSRSSFNTYTPPAEVVFSEKEANALILTLLENDRNARQTMEQMGIQSPVVSLMDNAVQMNAWVRYGGVSVPVTLNFALAQSAPNTVNLSVMSANVGRMAIGSDLQQKLINELHRVAPGGNIPLPQGISSVRVQAGRMIVVPDQNASKQQTPYNYNR